MIKPIRSRLCEIWRYAAEVRSIFAQSAVTTSAGGFGQRLRERFGTALGNDLTVKRDRSVSEPGLEDG